MNRLNINYVSKYETSKTISRYFAYRSCNCGYVDDLKVEPAPQRNLLLPVSVSVSVNFVPV